MHLHKKPAKSMSSDIKREIYQVNCFTVVQSMFRLATLLIVKFTINLNVRMIQQNIKSI